MISINIDYTKLNLDCTQTPHNFSVSEAYKNSCIQKRLLICFLDSCSRSKFTLHHFKFPKRKKQNCEEKIKEPSKRGND